MLPKQHLAGCNTALTQALWTAKVPQNNDILGHEGNIYWGAKQGQDTNLSTIGFSTSSLARLCLPGNAQAHFRGHHNVVTILKREDGHGYLVLERKSSSILQHPLGMARTWPILLAHQGDHARPRDVPWCCLLDMSHFYTPSPGNEGLLLGTDASSSIDVAKGIQVLSFLWFQAHKYLKK